VRVVSVMPKWKPGTQKGEAVRVKYTVPVMFRLTEDNTQVKYAPIENKIDEMVVVGYAPEETTYPEEVTVFEVVEKMPEYPGGMSAMMAFISKNIKYPVAAQKAKIQGRVVIQFIVDKEGNIICPRVIRGADPLLDAEAIRLTTIMPKWKPGMQRGQAVNVKYTVPIMFRLQEPEKNPAVQNATVTPTK
jgi:TonB family protein